MHSSNVTTPLVPSDNHVPPCFTATPASQCYTRAPNATTPLITTNNFTAPRHTTTCASDHNTAINLSQPAPSRHRTTPIILFCG
ncbi:hypothetical protein Pmani_030320 [Petrolisthes manimaculis]|nr:hypothetical protein Pmani_030320 [Petrolisthes manimaculis]